MLNTLSTTPTFISAAEHAQLTASTPSSFADIPPMLHLLDESVEVELDPVFESLSGRVRGKVWVTEAEVAFLPSAEGSSSGFSLPYPSLTLHAISPRTESSPAYLYCQIDETPAPGSTLANGDGDAEEEPEFTPMRELRIYVSDDSKLEPLFLALSHCASLHPSLEANGEPTSFFGGAFSSGEEDEGEDEDDTAEAGRAAFEYLESIVDWGNVPRPAGWGENSTEAEAVEDAEDKP